MRCNRQIGWMFQLTRPCGSRPAASFGLVGFLLFQLTRPCGSRLIVYGLSYLKACFNSRDPAGRDQKFSSKVIAVPFELLQDSEVDIEALINKRLRERIGRAQNSYFTNGSGVSQPKGLITASTVGKVGSAGKVITYDDLVDLQESVDDAYKIDGMSWMMTQQLRAEVRKMKDANGRPIWMPSYDAGIGAPQDELLLGERLVLNNHMAKPGLSAKTLAYGAMGKYVIRDVMEISLFRFADSAFTIKGQVGFLAWARAGGNLMDVGGAVKVYQQAAS